jgi:hypothetical protein
MNVVKFLSAVAAAALCAACSSEPAPPATDAAPETPPASAPPATTEMAAAEGPRVFFVEPKDGATVKSPVRLVFGVENFEISPVPATVETVRPNVGHHHVGVDTDCLPPGTEIPRANPWVHFGKGDAQMDMQLSPGPHKLALEIGDDKHTTIAGLCSTINITVTE